MVKLKLKRSNNRCIYNCNTVIIIINQMCGMWINYVELIGGEIGGGGGIFIGSSKLFTKCKILILVIKIRKNSQYFLYVSINQKTN